MNKIIRIKVSIFLSAIFYTCSIGFTAQQSHCVGAYQNQLIHLSTIQSMLSKSPASRINLCGTILTHENLDKINLMNINLNGADVSNASLKKANLNHAQLSHTYLRWTDLSGANLQWANLEYANLNDAILNGADLQYANLKGASLINAQLKGAILNIANLEGANLTHANLEGASLFSAQMNHSNLSQSNLNRADLEDASLIQANLSQTNLKETNLTKANLLNAYFEPQLHQLPDLISLLSTKNFSTIQFQNLDANIAVLTELRMSYHKLGLDSMEHQLTSIIQYHKMTNSFQIGGWHTISSTVSYLFFYLTSHYGAEPTLPLKILFFSIILFAVPYRIALSIANKNAGILIIWEGKKFHNWHKAKKISYQDIKICKTLNRHFLARNQDWFASQIRLFKLALYFSLITSFSIGWDEIHVGKWIGHLQSRDFILEGKGWVRILTGIQSLWSLYLVLLWIICSFGSPFRL